MKKNMIIPLVFLILGIGIFSGFYLISMLNPKEVQTEEPLVSEAELARITEVDLQYLQEVDQASVKINTAYSQKRKQLGPFTDYRKKTSPVPENKNQVANQPRETQETENKDISSPFVLSGIVGTNQLKLALIETNQETVIGRINETIAEFTIIDIKDDRVVLARENKTYELLLGSDNFEK
ncbi:MAG: hypothetical protein ACOC2O_02595 [Bacillota bacterium]